MKGYIILTLALLPLTASGQNLDSCSKTGENPMWSLISNHSYYLSESQLANGVKPKFPGDVLTNAVRFGYKHLVSKLLKETKLVRSHGGDALTAAASMGRIDMLRILIKSGISPNALNEMRATPIYGAVQFGCSRSVTFLISHGANVNFRSPYSTTLMIRAVADRRFLIASILLDNGYETAADELKSIKNILDKQGNFSVWEYLFVDHKNTVRVAAPTNW